MKELLQSVEDERKQAENYKAEVGLWGVQYCGQSESPNEITGHAVTGKIFIIRQSGPVRLRTTHKHNHSIQ